MLNYTLQQLGKTGFFISKRSNFLNDNMVSFLFCSRNAVFFIDVIQYVLNLRKMLYFFKNGSSARMRFWILSEDSAFRNLAKNYLKNLLAHIETNFKRTTRKFNIFSFSGVNKRLSLGRKLIFSDKFKESFKDDLFLFPLFMKRIKKTLKKKKKFNKFIKFKKVGVRIKNRTTTFKKKRNLFLEKMYRVLFFRNKVRSKRKLNKSSNFLKQLNSIIQRFRRLNFLSKKYSYAFSKKMKMKVVGLKRNLISIVRLVKKLKKNFKKVKSIGYSRSIRKIVKKKFFSKNIPYKKSKYDKSLKKHLRIIAIVKNKIYDKVKLKIKSDNVFEILKSKIEGRNNFDLVNIEIKGFLEDFIFLYFLYYEVKVSTAINFLKTQSQDHYNISRKVNIFKELLKKNDWFLRRTMKKRTNVIKRRFFDIYKGESFMLFKEKKRLRFLSFKYKRLLKVGFRKYKFIYSKYVKCKRLGTKVVSFNLLEKLSRAQIIIQKKLKLELKNIFKSVIVLTRKLRKTRNSIIYLMRHINFSNKLMLKGNMNKSYFYSLLNFNKFSNFVYEYKSRFFKNNFNFWTNPWLQGALSNFNGLKRTYRGKNIDFRRIRFLPDFFVLLTARNKEEVKKEVFLLKIPLLGVSDIGDNPYFYNYTMLSNTGSNSLLFFYLCLILESSFRGYVSETKKFLG